MSTFTNLLFHIIYSTKYRKPLIQTAWQDDLYGYIGGIIRESKGKLLKIGGIADHVHLLAKLSPTLAISDRQNEFFEMDQGTKRCSDKISMATSHEVAATLICETLQGRFGSREAAAGCSHGRKPMEHERYGE
jgi:hypothetical protein